MIEPSLSARVAKHRAGVDNDRQNPLLLLPAADNAAMPTEPPKAEPPKRRRRWFQFSLSSLMVGVTLLAVPCAYIGWQAKIVRERRAELNRTVDARLVGIADNDEERVNPWIRRVFGDQRVASIRMLVGTSEAELVRLRVLFPEAKIEVWSPADQVLIPALELN